MRIASNIAGLFAYNRLEKASKKTEKAMQKLLSGMRINNAADDAAGLAISEKMRGQINGLKMAARNAQDGISLVQTAEGALQQTHSILQRMRELTVQAANDTYVQSDREIIAREVSRLIEGLEGIVEYTEFNTRSLFLGNDGDPIVLQVGANSNQKIEVYIEKSTIACFGYFFNEIPGLLIGFPGDNVFVDLSTNNNANQFLGIIDKAISDVSSIRSNLGATQNRLEHVISNLDTAQENLTAAESRIRDADLGRVMVEFTKQQIIEKTAVAMLAQANKQPSNVLSLLK